MRLRLFTRTLAISLLLCAISRATEHTFLIDTTGWQPQPRTMHLAGDFNGWSTTTTPMQVNTGKVWSVTINLEDGQHYYKFVADAGTPNQKWLNDPNADKSLEASDGNGGMNSGVIVGVDTTKLPPAKPNDVNLDAVRFDPKDPADLSRLDDTHVRIRVRVLANDVQSIAVLPNGHGTGTALQRIDTERGSDVYSAIADVGNAAAGHDTGFIISLTDGDHTAAMIDANGVAPARDSKQTMIHVPAAATPHPTPAWTRDAVWYQIFVDRFRNGDASNDPGDFSKYERLIPWNADWWTTQPNEVPGDQNFYRGAGNVWNRRYGGDLQGVIEELPYLRSLGVNALYLNPIFEAESMHKYDTADYRHVDDNFGVRDGNRGSATRPARLGNHEFFNLDGSAATSPETEDPATWHWSKSDLLFLQLIQAAHEQGFKVIIDGVFNHVGRAHPFFLDVLKNGKRSKFGDWFEITDWGDPKNWHEMPDPFAVHGKPGGIQWHAWDGANGWLPALKKDAAHGLAPGPRAHILAIAKRWGDPDGNPQTNDGIDGWRLDAANEVPHPFWVDFRTAVYAANPQSYITGEIWSPAQAWVNDGKEFDAVMNYQFAMAAQDFFVNQRTQIKPSVFNDRLARLWFMYPAPNALAMQNLFDSHDTDRVASMIVNPDRPYDGQNRPQDNASGNPYDSRKPNEQEWTRLLQMVAFQQCFAGAPMTYYGDEAGMWSPDDPSNRQPLPWPDKGPYADGVGFNQNIFNGFQRIIAIRNALAPLRDGDFYPVKIDDQSNVYAFARQRGDQVVYIVLNRSSEQRSIDVGGLIAGDYVNFADPVSVRIEMPKIQVATARPVPVVNENAKKLTPRDGHLTVDLPGFGVAILAR